MRAPIVIGGVVALMVGIGVATGRRKGAPALVVPQDAGALPYAATRTKRSATRAVVYHTTSRTFTGRIVAQGHDPMSPGFLEAAVERYRYTGAEDFANALVAPDGSYEWLAHPDLSVRHAVTPDGTDGPPPSWWRDRWPELDNPAELLALGRGRYINRETVAIDVIPLPDAGAVQFSEASLDTAARLGRELAARYDLTLERRHHLAHSDLDPWGRGTSAGGWDPGWDWTDFMARVNGQNNRKAVA